MGCRTGRGRQSDHDGLQADIRQARVKRPGGGSNITLLFALVLLLGIHLGLGEKPFDRAVSAHLSKHLVQTRDEVGIALVDVKMHGNRFQGRLDDKHGPPNVIGKHVWS